MPEEINLLLTDQMADLLFTPSEDADQNQIFFEKGSPLNVFILSAT